MITMICIVYVITGDGLCSGQHRTADVSNVRYMCMSNDPGMESWKIHTLMFDLSEQTEQCDWLRSEQSEQFDWLRSELSQQCDWLRNELSQQCDWLRSELSQQCDWLRNELSQQCDWLRSELSQQCILAARARCDYRTIALWGQQDSD